MGSSGGHDPASVFRRAGIQDAERVGCTPAAGWHPGLLLSAARCDEGVSLGRGGMRALQERMDGSERGLRLKFHDGFSLPMLVRAGFQKASGL